MSLEVRDAMIDVLMLRDTLRNGRAAPERLAEFASRVRGEFLDGLDLPNCPGFQGWLVAEREAVRVLRRKLLTALIAACGEDLEAAVVHARALVESEPRDETAQIGLIRLLVRTGRLREAREQHQVAMRLVETADTSVASPLAAVLREIDSARPRAVASTVSGSAAQDAGSLQQIRFCVAGDGARIAYATAGAGPPLVKAAELAQSSRLRLAQPDLATSPRAADGESHAGAL